MSEMLIRRRLDIISQLIIEYKLSIKIQQIPSQDNRADALTRIPSGILKGIPNAVNDKEIRKIHERTHFGIQRTKHLVEEALGCKISEESVKNVVKDCEACSRIDPSNINVNYSGGFLQASRVCEVWYIDLVHVKNHLYLSVVDSYSRFTMWVALKDERAQTVSASLELLFSISGPPENIHSDNGTIFHSREFRNLFEKWEINQTFSCAYRPQGNGVVERMHREIKRAVGRSGRSVAECVFWHNNSCLSEVGVPFETVFSSRCKKPGVNNVWKNIHRNEFERKLKDNGYNDLTKNPFLVGDKVFLRNPKGKCDVPWSGPHTVTRLFSKTSAELNDDNIRRHISHMRIVPKTKHKNEPDIEFEVDFKNNDAVHPTSGRPQRLKKALIWHNDYHKY